MKNLFVKGLGILKRLINIGVTVAPFVKSDALPAWAAPVSAALPALTEAAEKAFGDGTGSTKKEFVIAGAKAIVDLMKKTSTGGQFGTWTDIEKIVDGSLEAIVTQANAIAAELKADAAVNG